jgi:hypothetical protein
MMKNIKVTRAQRQVLELLSQQDINAIRKNPKLVAGAKHLLVACKKIAKKVEDMPQYAGRKRRETMSRRIIDICNKAIQKAGN